MPMVSSVIFVISYACPRGLRAALYPFRPLAKVAVDLTPLRSSKTKRQTIQPPPQISILKCWSVAFVSHKSWNFHKTSGIKPRQVQCISFPFHISFIANIARKRPELNRGKTILPSRTSRTMSGAGHARSITSCRRGFLRSSSTAQKPKITTWHSPRLLREIRTKNRKNQTGLDPKLTIWFTSN
jgi:hypothetical protein